MTLSAKGDTDRHCLAARFVDGPHLSVPDKAEQHLADWLADLEPVQRAAIGDLVMRFPRARIILLGIVEASPYLFDLVRADGGRALRLLECEPEEHLAQLIETARREVVAASSEAEAMQLLRRMKSEAALLIALCDIGGVWPTGSAISSRCRRLRSAISSNALRSPIPLCSASSNRLPICSI